VSSGINDAHPEQGNATTASVRNNFTAAKKEINDLQKMSTMFNRTAGDGAAYTVSLTDQFETNALVDGARITVEIHTVSTSTTPTLTVTAGGTSTGAKTIVKAGSAGGSALVAGDLKEDAIIDLMYVASGGDGITDKWVWLNCVSGSPNIVSPALSGTPTAPTATEGNNTTQIATTAFVQTATPDASDSVKGIAELATAGEVKAGTDAGRVITPNALLGTAIINDALVVASTSTGGQDNQLSIGGVIIKWGKRTSNTDAAQTYRFNDQSASALPFPTACEVVLTTTTDDNSSDNIAVTAKDANGFTINKSGSDSEEFFFLAIGR
jgi:hypothetical protein|tara:strand:- start:105 stop:1076 length:972 start_codon:yes stop_codon:yes gene_type:complete